MPAKVWWVWHTSKQQGTAGKYRELQGKANAFYRQLFAPSYPVSYFHRPLDTKVGRCISYSIVFRPSDSLWHSECGQVLPYFCADSTFCNIGAEYRKRVQRAHFYLYLFLLFYPPSWLISGLNQSLLFPSTKKSVRTFFRMSATSCKHSLKPNQSYNEEECR